MYYIFLLYYDCETLEKRIYIYIYVCVCVCVCVFFFFFFLKMSESAILTRNGTDKTLDLSLDLG